DNRLDEQLEGVGFHNIDLIPYPRQDSRSSHPEGAPPEYAQPATPASGCMPTAGWPRLAALRREPAHQDRGALRLLEDRRDIDRFGRGVGALARPARRL